MAQHDYTIANQGFPATRSDINNVLSAISTNNSGTSAPSTQYAGQFWIDTTSSTWTMYIHDGADDIAFATIDTSANTVNFTDSALDVVTDTTPQLGGDLDLNSNDITGTGNINVTGNITASGTLSATLPVSSLSGLLSFRNIIINGDMSIAQRGTSFTGLTSTQYTVDRQRAGIQSAGTWTISQSTDVPSGQGFGYSLKYDCTTADTSLGAGDVVFNEQRIEGQNLQYLKKGTANAESLTVSFWVKSNKTGTYIFQLNDTDNDRAISKSYTISSANTWEKKTITYPGDTTGAFVNDNLQSLRARHWLVAGSDHTSGTLATSWENRVIANEAVGQVNLADSTSNEWYVTGIQLEAGTTASDFEFLPVDVNEKRCLRYYYLVAEGNQQSFGMGFYYSSSFLLQADSYPVRMRATPSLHQTSGAAYYGLFRNSAEDTFSEFILNVSGSLRSNDKYYEIYDATNASGTVGQAGFFRTSDASAFIAFDAEL